MYRSVVCLNQLNKKSNRSYVCGKSHVVSLSIRSLSILLTGHIFSYIQVCARSKSAQVTDASSSMSLFREGSRRESYLRTSFAMTSNVEALVTDCQRTLWAMLLLLHVGVERVRDRRLSKDMGQCDDLAIDLLPRPVFRKW